MRYLVILFVLGCGDPPAPPPDALPACADVACVGAVLCEPEGCWCFIDGCPQVWCEP